MLYIGIFVALLVSIFALVYTIKLGETQVENEEKYEHRKSYSILSTIYGILFLCVFIIVLLMVMYVS